jgi:uncharacterized membrane protein YgcG
MSRTTGMFTIAIKGMKAAAIGAIGMALIGFALFLIFGPGEATVFGIVLALVVGGAGGGLLFGLFRYWKQPTNGARVIQERRIRKYFRSPAGRIKLLLGTAGGLALLIATFTVPQSSEQKFNIYERGLEGGPDSYFHHIYDPKHLLGQLGSVDLELSNFQRATGNIILFAAFEQTPSDDPWFTFHLAERWAPGKRGEDRGVVIFVFMKERRIRAEVGYGYEGDLTDVRTKHILEQKMIPLLREGKTEEAVEATARELQQNISYLKGTGQGRSFSDELPVYKREIRRRVGLIFRIWKAVPLIPRLIITGLVLLLWIGLMSLASGLLQGVIGFANYIRNRQGRKSDDSFHEFMGMIKPLLNIVYAAALIFIVMSVGEYFYTGKGLFGGGGVTLFW